MTHLVERLSELRRHLAHLRDLQPKAPDVAALEQDMTLHNDVLFSLLIVCQLVIELAGELSAAKGLRYEDYTEAVRNLRAYEEFPAALVEELVKLPGFRNVVMHEYVTLDLERAVAALHRLEPVEQFADAVHEWASRQSF